MKDKTEISRRTVLGRWLAGSALVALMTIPAQALGRFTKAASHYMNHPNGAQRCAGCRHFQPPGSCEVVMGHVRPGGWCKWFRARRHMGMGY